MKIAKISAQSIKALLYKQKMATMADFKAILNTQVEMTVYRKLKELPYLKSYSDRGKFYTLKDIPTFDLQGLWRYQSVSFSRFGTLIDTLAHFINTADGGYFEIELEEALKVCVRAPLLKLYQAQKVAREKVLGRYLYYSVTPAVGMLQRQSRRDMFDSALDGVESVGREILHHELKAAIILFFSLLNEQQRRLYAGLESLMCGYGGDRKVADLLGLDEHTIAKGRKQILQRDIELDGIRKPGGGRKSLEKKHPKSSPPSKQ